MQPVVCVFGMRGYGKSTLSDQLVASDPRVLAFDPRGEHALIALPWDHFRAYFHTPLRPRFRVALAREYDHGDDFCAYALEIGRELANAATPDARTYTVLIDEADLVCPPGAEPEEFSQLVGQGRTFRADQTGGCKLVLCSRRPAEVSRRATSQADDWYLFRIQEPKDLTYLRSMIGEETTAAVATLDKYEYVHWTPAGIAHGRTTARGANQRTHMGPTLDEAKIS